MLEWLSKANCLLNSIVKITLLATSHRTRKGGETEHVSQTQSILEGKLLTKICNLSEKQLQIVLKVAKLKPHGIKRPEKRKLTNRRPDFKFTFKF